MLLPCPALPAAYQAARPLTKGEVVLVYEGRLITRQDHTDYCQRDEWELDVPQEAYTMAVTWTQVCV